MFEDDDFDLELSEPLLDVTNSGVHGPGVIDQSQQQHQQRSPSSHRNSFSFKCPPAPNHLNPPGAQSPRNVTTSTNSYKKSFEFSFERSEKTDRSTRDFVERFESSLKRKEIEDTRSRNQGLTDIHRDWDNNKNAKRKFPGPAGIVKTPQHHLVGDKRIVPSDQEDQEDSHNQSVDRNAGEIEDTTQTLSTCSTWMLAVEDLRPIFPEHNLAKYNIAWIKKQTALTFVPHFLCKILKLDLTFKDPVVVLADKSGTIDGNFHRDIPELYGKDVRVGSVILVARVAVLKTVKAEYLNITLNNLASIYSRSDVHHIKRHTKEDFMKFETEFQRQSEMKMNVAANIPDGHQSRETGSKNLHLTYTKPSIPASPVMPVLSPSTIRNVAGPSYVDATRKNNGLNTTSSSSKFTFKSSPRPQVSHPEVKSVGVVTSSASAHQCPSLEVGPPAQSQHLVASLLDDLDSSDIWADF